MKKCRSFEINVVFNSKKSSLLFEIETVHSCFYADFFKSLKLNRTLQLYYMYYVQKIVERTLKNESNFNHHVCNLQTSQVNSLIGNKLILWGIQLNLTGFQFTCVLSRYSLNIRAQNWYENLKKNLNDPPDIISLQCSQNFDNELHHTKKGQCFF